MFVIVGLGNPGEKYEKTRHNIGRMLVNTFREENEFFEWTKSKNAEAMYSKGTIDDVFVELILPEAFMNNSGKSVKYAVTKLEVKPEHVVVVYDDVDLAIGKVKVSFGKGAGGHNGILSIINAIDTKDFIRIRVGVAGKSFWTGKSGRPAAGLALNKHVLGNFKKREQGDLDAASGAVDTAIKTIVTKGVEAAMNEVN